MHRDLTARTRQFGGRSRDGNGGTAATDAAAAVALHGERLERRGQLANEYDHLSAERRLGDLQVELAQLDARIAKATDEWQATTVAEMMLETLRQEYEQTRQPETLREASGYFERLTNGRYRRIRSALEGDRLVVDDATDWDEVCELVTESFCLMAPKRLAARVARPSAEH